MRKIASEKYKGKKTTLILKFLLSLLNNVKLLSTKRSNVIIISEIWFETNFWIQRPKIGINFKNEHVRAQILCLLHRVHKPQKC